MNPLTLERAFAQTPFYQRKTIRSIIGFQPGDNHDQWVRFYARFLGKQIPGNPDFVVQNMPGTGIALERLKILRDVFLKMFKDPEVMAEIKKRNWEADPVAGEELDALAKEVVDQPPDVAAALKRILSK